MVFNGSWIYFLWFFFDAFTVFLWFIYYAFHWFIYMVFIGSFSMVFNVSWIYFLWFFFESFTICSFTEPIGPFLLFGNFYCLDQDLILPRAFTIKQMMGQSAF